MTQFQTDQGAFASIVNRDMAAMATRVGVIEGTIRQREEAIKSAFDATAAQHATDMATLVASAKSEFDVQRLQLQQQQQQLVQQLAQQQQQQTQLQTIAAAVQVEFGKLQQQIDEGASREHGGDTGPKFNKGFIPVKDLKPTRVAKEEQWRDWAESFA